MLEQVPYVAGRLARRVIPEGLARRYLTNDFDSLRHLIEIHELQLEALRQSGVDLTGETVLEVGPGRYNPAVAAFVPSGAARAVFVERSRGDLDEQFLGQRLLDLLGAFGYSGAQWRQLGQPDRSPDVSTSTFGQRRLQFLWRSAEDTGLPSASVQAIFSNAVLQCLAEPEAVARELARVLKPGGFMFHRVDLRDHFFRFPLQFLCYSDYVWSHVLTSRVPHKAYLNRLRLPEWRELFEGLGLKVKTEVVEQDVTLVRRLRPHLNERFRGFSDEELSPLIAHVYCWR